MMDDSFPDPDLSEYFRNSVDLLSVFKVGGKFGVTNPAWERMLGWSPEDLKNKAFIEFVHPDDVEPTLAESVAEWDDAAPTRSGFENRLRCRDGSYRWIEWTSQRRGDLIYSTGRDVTLRNIETAELAAYAEMTKAIFAAAADLIVIVDRDLIISRNSPRGQSFFGYDDDVAMGASVFQLMHPDDRPEVERTLKKMFEENSHEVVSLRYRAQRTEKTVPKIRHDDDNPGVGWPQLWAYIAQTNRFDLMQKRLSDKAIKDMWDADEDVPGVERMIVPDVSITKI